MWKPTLPAIFFLLLAASASREQQPRTRLQDAAKPSWLWSGAPAEDQRLFFRKSFRLSSRPKRAVVVGSCDNKARIWLNDKLVGESSDWQRPFRFDVSKLLREGRNTIAVRAYNEGGPAGLCARLEIGKRVIVTDRTWRVGKRAVRGWRKPAFDDSKWAACDVVAALGAGPWSGSVHAGALADAAIAATKPLAVTAKRTDRLQHPPGFVVEELLTVPKRLGSWVALARGPGGSLFTAGQGGGLFRVTPATIRHAKGQTKVAKLDVDLPGMHGLLYSRDRLYVICNGKSGLYSLRDTTGDDEFDEVRLLRKFEGAGEHGPHSIVEDPNNPDHLVMVAGNYTSVPELAHSRVPQRWDEDLVLPRIWDPRGHARGRKAPGGWIARLDREGKEFELVTCGFRNPFDIAFSPDGELFTYDADMEWDFGLPWYRPTRICHAVSGVDFGWRAGSGKWSPYFEDSLPAAVDIGPGSPTGLLFGTGARFPTKYQRALFALDWTFGTIWAVHLRSQGASFVGEKEPFVTGTPLAVCDAVIGDDGAMYFVTGGRGLQSKLYRIYAPEKPEATAVATDGNAASRRARRQLEALHARGAAPDLDSTFAQLANADRFVAYAARVALEHVPVGDWSDRALAMPVSAPRAKVRALIALARCAPKSMRARVLSALEALPFEELAPAAQLGVIRAVGLVDMRLGPMTEGERARVGKRFLPVLRASDDARVARELCRLLARFETTGVIGPALDRMERARSDQLPDWATVIKRNATYGNPIRRMLDNPPPTEGLFYANALRRLGGWSLDEHRRYFAFLNRSRGGTGGASYRGFVEHFRREVMERLSKERRKELQPQLLAWFQAESKVKVRPPKGPGRKWGVAEAAKLFEAPLRGRSHASGKNLFHAAQCFRCHRFDGEGGAIGPDLSSIAQRLDAKQILEAIIDPNLAVSDQYVSTRVITKDGEEYEGLVVDNSKGKPNGWVEVWPVEADEEPYRFRNRQIRSRKPLATSPMPGALLDPLNRDEVMDLIAYMLSGGDPKHEVFRK